MNKELFNKHKKYIQWFKEYVPLYDYSCFDDLETLDSNFEKKVNLKKIKSYEYIVVHHGEIKTGNMNYYKWLHKAIFNWDDIGYHYVIGNSTLSADGEIEIGRKIIYQGAHVKNNNHNTIQNSAQHYVGKNHDIPVPAALQAFYCVRSPALVFVSLLSHLPQ